MIERKLFESALEFADPQARQAFLDQACQGDGDLRAKVDALLNSHAAAGSFLDIPVGNQIGPRADNITTNTFVREPAADSEDSDDSQPDLSFLQPSNKPGSIGVLAHYEVLSLLGQGAFGIVFKAFDEKLHRLVAIKVMNPQMASTSPPRKRFLREARSAAAIKHENVVQVYSVEELPLPYLVMEFVDGQTLKQKLDSSGPLETPEVLHIARQIASGLAAAQAMGLIHRDIKPANILLEQGAEQRVKISDFGLARAADDASLTRTGVISGTPLYMAPEQATGQTLDHRADLFSLGSVVYQMACGRPPFRAATTVAVLRRVVEDTPRPLPEILPEIPDWLVAIVMKLLAKKPEDRFQTAKEVADLLARCQSELQLNGKVTCVPTNKGEVPAQRSDLLDGKCEETGTDSISPRPRNRGRGVGGEGQLSVAQPLPDQNASSPRVTRLPSRRPLLIAASLLGIAVLAVILFNVLNVLQKDESRRVAALGRPSDTQTTNNSSPKTAEGGHPTNPEGWHSWSADAPPPAIAPFDAEQAKQHQAAWAKYLDVPVEYTNSIGMTFRLIPPGEFLMGSKAAEIQHALASVSDPELKERILSEGPQHKVILTQPIYLGVYEVTQSQYEQVMGKNPSYFAATGPVKEAADKVAGMDTTDHPVEVVSWNDAADFCTKRSQQEKLKPFYFRADQTVTMLDGTGYRLPTEAEWEFSCRAGTTTKYWSGDQDGNLVATDWIGTNSDLRTHSVGELKANPFGLYDFHGNIREWVQDWWEPNYYGQFQVNAALNPSGPSHGVSLRVSRGGQWGHPVTYCRASFRLANSPTHTGIWDGFRVALMVDAVRQALKVDDSKILKPGAPVGANGNPVAKPGRSAWDDLDPAQIPEAERVPRQPEGLVAVLGQHRRRVWSTIRSSSVSSDGTQFLLTTDDGLHVFGPDPRQPTGFFNFGFEHPSATFLPDGRIAAFVDDAVAGRQLQIFAKPRDGVSLERQTATSASHNERIHHATASADGRWLAAFDLPANIGLWRLGDATPQRVAKFVLRAIDGNIPPVSFSPDAHWFCYTDTSQGQGTVHLIDLRGDTPREATVLKADADEKGNASAKGFEHGAFLSDGRLATADRNGRTWFWKINDGKPQRVGSIPESGWIYPAAKALRLAINVGGATFSLWDLSADPPQALSRADHSSFTLDNISTLAIAPNGETVFTGHLNGAARFWSVTQAAVAELDPLVPNPKVADLYGVRLKVVDRFLCTSAESSRTGIWQPTRNGMQALIEASPTLGILGASSARRQLIVRELGKEGGTVLLRCDANHVMPTRRITGNNARSSALNDQGDRLTIGRHNGTEEVIELWGLVSDELPAKKLSEIKLSPDSVPQQAFAEAGLTLIGRAGQRIQIWDVKDDQLILRTALAPRANCQFAVAPDGQSFATASYDGLELWNLKSDLTQPTARFAIPGTGTVAFSPDGRRLAASFWEHGVSTGLQIINLANGVVEKRLTFPGQVQEVTFTDDSRHLITGNANGTIYVVRLEAWKPLTSSATSPVDFAGWSKQVASRSADGQAVEVIKKLRELNPQFDGKFSHKVENGVVVELWIQNPHITDISPISALPELKTLQLAGSTSPNQIGRLVDLSPLAGMKLTSLDCSFTRVKDLSPLKGMKLTKLHCGNTKVEDLTPLAEMPLTDLDCGYTGISDLSPLKGMPLTKLAIYSTHMITDLSALKGLPLTELVLFHNGRVTDLSPLKGMKLTVLDCYSTGVTDLSPLKGMPLTFLQCANTKVSDLSPLEGMPLTGLFCFATQVEDLSPLRGMPLKRLLCNRTPVNDAGLKLLSGQSELETLDLAETKVSATGIASLRKALPNCKITSEPSPPGPAK